MKYLKYFFIFLKLVNKNYVYIELIWITAIRMNDPLELETLMTREKYLIYLKNECSEYIQPQKNI